MTAAEAGTAPARYRRQARWNVSPEGTHRPVAVQIVTERRGRLPPFGIHRARTWAKKDRRPVLLFAPGVELLVGDSAHQPVVGRLDPLIRDVALVGF